MNFGEAFIKVKQGKKICRKGWNGKGMYVQLVKKMQYDSKELEPFLVIKNMQNTLNTWVPSIADLLAEDWEVIDYEA